MSVRPNEYDYRGRVGLVTGGASGIGLETCKRLLAGGAAVAMIDNSTVALARATEDLGADRVLAVEADVSDSASVTAALQQVEQTLGPPDIVVCSAGLSNEPPRLIDLTDEEFRRMFAVNTEQIFYFLRGVIPGMVERDYGRFVAVASVAGKEGNPAEAAYSASKAAVINLIRGISKAYATTGLRFHSVAPAVIDTPMGTGDDIDPTLIEYMLSKIPMERVGKPEEVAALIAFLVSDEFTFSTGSCFDVSGGRATF
jgi:2-dehydro-3-deoxy-L-rhamnonate dehydrogenase (NAD+)